MRKFIYFLCADAGHLERRLNNLARKGLELLSVDGLFTGCFEQTKRTDLSYMVIPYGKKQNYPHNIDCTAFGWTLIGGYNGMAILKSQPCVDADRYAILAKFSEEDCYHRDRFSVGLLQCLLFLYAAVLFLFPVSRPDLTDWWFLSYFGIALPVLRCIVVAALIANILTFRTYWSAWVHGLTVWVVWGASWLVLVFSRLDDRGSTMGFVLVLCLFALAGFASFWNMSRTLSIAACALSAAVLCFGLIFPHVSREGVNLRTFVQDEPVVTLADLGDDSKLKAGKLTTEGTFLVQKLTYWEISENGHLTVEVYRCMTSRIAQSVAQHEGEIMGNSLTGYCIWKGKTVWVFQQTDSMDEATVERIEQLILP